MRAGNQIELPSGSLIDNIEEINPNGRIAGGKSLWPNAKSRSGDDKDLSEITSRNLIAEETAFISVKEGWYTLTNPELNLSFKLEWDASIFRCVWFWQNYNLPDYPYYGAAWNIAI